MLTTTHTCDRCGKDISDRSDAVHRLALSEDHIWRDTSSTAPPPLPLLDREHHFCGMKCLYQWIINSVADRT